MAECPLKATEVHYLMPLWVIIGIMEVQDTGGCYLFWEIGLFGDTVALIIVPLVCAALHIASMALEWWRQEPCGLHSGRLFTVFPFAEQAVWPHSGEPHCHLIYCLLWPGVHALEQ